MGNHELNALAFHTPDPNKPGSHLRPHNEKNSNQHAETIRQVPAGELASYLAWFRTLPLWLDLDGLRVVHACWDDPRMARISGSVTDEFLHAACSPVIRRAKTGHSSAPKTGHHVGGTRWKNRLIWFCWQGA
jgi:hypothetical protein